MPPQFFNPESALRRSENLLALGTPQSKQQALDSLAEVFQSKRFKQTPIPTLEPIVTKFLELCLDLQKPRLARDALSLYKMAAQHVSIPSMEKVIKEFLGNCERKLTSAQAEAAKQLGESETESQEGEKEVDDVEDDLELPLQPVTLLLDSLVDQNEHQAQGKAQAGQVMDKARVERSVVLPWLKFNWEAYKSCLDVCKSNNRFEVLYANIALAAFKFCRTHSRRSEFRRLCEQLRKDILNAQKYSAATHAIDFSDPETLTRHLDTRFAQLETAVEMELWQEAFRSIEDVHGLLVNPAAKKATKPAMMANYYEKLTRIFNAEAGTTQMAVFHAAAWSRYLQFAERERERKEAQTGQTVTLANEKAPGCTLLSALAVPIIQATEAAPENRNTQRLVALLNLSKMPTRQGLIKDVLAKNLLRRVPAEIRKLYDLVETEFHPLTVGESIAPLIKTLSEDAEYAPYVRNLRHVVVTRLFKSLSELYSTISIEHVLELLQPLAGTVWQVNETYVEKFLTAASKRGELAITIDHVAKAITFAEPEKKPSPLAELTNLSSESQQPSSTLSRIAQALQNTIYYLHPELVEQAHHARAQALQSAVAAADEERKAQQHRIAIVARRRQKLDEIRSRREKEEQSAKAERERHAAIQLQLLQEERQRQAERERVQREIDAVKTAEAKKLRDQLKARGALKVDVEDEADLDTDKLLRMQAEQLEKEQKEKEQRLRIIAKRVDHLERAMRKEEIPLVAQDYERQQAEDRDTHKHAIAAAQQVALEKHQHDLALKSRLTRMMEDYSRVRSAAEAKRAEEFRQKRAAAEKKIEQEKKKLRERVLKEHEEKVRQAQEEARKREEEERQAEERRIAEEKAAEEARAKEEQEEAERAAKRAEREAARKADEERIQAQLRREEEAEQRRLERLRQGSSAPVAAPSTSGAPATSTGGRPRLNLAPRTAPRDDSASTPAPPRPNVPAGGWREREAARAAAGGETAPSPSASESRPAATGAYRPPRSRMGEGDKMPQSGAPASGAAADGKYRTPARGDAEGRSASGAWRRG